MIRMPYDQIIESIKVQSSINEAELQKKIDDKMKQLSGLISKEGAAHIVANEMGIKLFDKIPSSGKLQIKNIIPGLRNVETVGKVIQKYEVRHFKTNEREGKVCSFLMADETGTIRAVLWGNQADHAANFSEGSIVKVVGGYVRENNNYNELHLNDKSKLIIDPAGETINVKTRSMERKSIQELNESDQNVEILGTVVQVFDPRFFEVDPKTGKKVTQRDGAFYAGEELVSVPDYSYVMNLIIDDGSSNIRAVFFRDSMEKLTRKNKDTILEYRQNPGLFEDVKTDLLGTLIKLQGRVKKNLFFDRIEFMANDVTINPDPEEEIQRLNAAMEKAKQ